jgi:uncharacterized protein with HEPN domain
VTSCGSANARCSSQGDCVRSRPISPDLDSDEQLALTIVRLLEIVGEAAKQVSAETRTAHPGIPWREIAGTRDRLIHGYFDVELDVVWSIVTGDLPSLVEGLESMVSSGT